MSFWSSVRSFGRAIDPTNPSAPLGGIARTAIGVVPGGSAALGIVDGYNATTRDQPTNREPTPGAAVSGASPGVPMRPPAPVPSRPVLSRLGAFFSSGTGIAVALAGVLGLTGLLVVLRRKGR